MTRSSLVCSSVFRRHGVQLSRMLKILTSFRPVHASPAKAVTTYLDVTLWRSVSLLSVMSVMLLVGKGHAADFNHFPREGKADGSSQATMVDSCDDGPRMLQTDLTYMMLQAGLPYGSWDKWDLCHDPPACSNLPDWHLNFSQ